MLKKMFRELGLAIVVVLLGLYSMIAPISTLSEDLNEALGKTVATETESETEVKAEPGIETETEIKTESETKTKSESIEIGTVTNMWAGPVLNSVIGSVQGPSGKETYYNLEMSGVIAIMQSLGYDYKYWVRSDGVKMYGEYIMCAADLNLRPRGTLVETSLGTAMVCDTGTFIYENPSQLDIAVTW